MKTLFFFLLVVTSLLLSCGPSPLPEQYRAVLPAVPSLWTELLGEPHWRLEWYDPAGRFQSTELDGTGVGISVLSEWPNAVLAWPYWPEKALTAGIFYPAGALYPFDVRGTDLVLSWEGGIDARFYRELDTVRTLNTTNRVPEYFDWMRFRTLLWEESPEDLRVDPWLADWKGIAEKTVNSGFRKTLLKAEKRTGTGVLLPCDGPWAGASPFRPLVVGQKGEKIILPLGPRPELLVCSGGIFRISPGLQLWAPFPH